MELYLKTAFIVLAVTVASYVIIRLSVNWVSEYIIKNKAANENAGYCRGYSVGYNKGLAAGREEGKKVALILDVNARATVNDIRKAYGFQPIEYLKNMRENGVITQDEFEERMGRVGTKAI